MRRKAITFILIKINQLMEQNQNSSLFQLNLDAQNSYVLRSAASWSKVLGIVGLIIGILCIIFGIIAQQTLNSYSSSYDYNYRSSGVSTRTMGAMGLMVYAIMGLIMIITSIFAFNGGNKIIQGLKNNDQAALNAGFAGVRNYFAFWS